MGKSSAMRQTRRRRAFKADGYFATTTMAAVHKVGAALAHEMAHSGDVKRLRLRPFRFGQTQEHEDGTVERLDIFGSQRSDQTSEPPPWHSSQLVHHHSAWRAQSTLSAGLNGRSEDRCRRRIGGQGAHDDGIVRVESVVLNNHRRTRFADIGGAPRDGPDLASLHSASQAEIASTNA